jgi:hypothetical protein
LNGGRTFALPANSAWATKTRKPPAVLALLYGVAGVLRRRAFAWAFSPVTSLWRRRLTLMTLT